MMNCHQCQKHLVAYIHDEATPRIRRRVAAHLDTCESCYAAYVRERDASTQMTQDLAWFGQPDNAQLTDIWANVQGTWNQPTQRQRAYRWQHGLMMAAMVLLSVLPWSLNVGNLVHVPVPFQATPAVSPQNTPQGTAVGVVRVAFDVNTPTEDVLPPTPTSTPPMAPVPNMSNEQR